ncbi:hypothetical protein ACHAW6_000833 [Cyclotella cf. meneghiniana]
MGHQRNCLARLLAYSTGSQTLEEKIRFHPLYGSCTECL